MKTDPGHWEGNLTHFPHVFVCLLHFLAFFVLFLNFPICSDDDWPGPLGRNPDPHVFVCLFYFSLTFFALSNFQICSDEWWPLTVFNSFCASKFPNVAVMTTEIGRWEGNLTHICYVDEINQTHAFGWCGPTDPCSQVIIVLCMIREVIKKKNIIFTARLNWGKKTRLNWVKKPGKIRRKYPKGDGGDGGKSPNHWVFFSMVIDYYWLLLLLFFNCHCYHQVGLIFPIFIEETWPVWLRIFLYFLALCYR